MNRVQRLASLVALLLAVADSSAAVAQAPAGSPGPVFTAPLADMPGKQLVVVELRLPPKQEGRPTPPAHRHPGSVYVYVTAGTARLGIQGEPVREVTAGESFFEPMGALHTVTESASSTEPATAIAIMIVPEGAPLVTLQPNN